MNKKVYETIERKPSHAGEILRTGFIEQYDLTIETVAELLGITRQHLSRIINGHNPVTPDIAIRLEVLTHAPASQWLAIQSDYDTYMLSQGQSFKNYKKTLDNWSSKALHMSSKERQGDQKTMKLIEKAATFAKQLGKTPSKKLAIG